MPIMIRDPRVEAKIEKERRERGDRSRACTLRDLALERLMQLEGFSPGHKPDGTPRRRKSETIGA